MIDPEKGNQFKEVGKILIIRSFLQISVFLAAACLRFIIWWKSGSFNSRNEALYFVILHRLKY